MLSSHLITLEQSEAKFIKGGSEGLAPYPLDLRELTEPQHVVPILSTQATRTALLPEYRSS
jgi:hypothetical protein